jgi:polyisoprenoid-binding protein YceI
VRFARRLAVATMLVLVASGTGAEPVTYRLDPDHTFVHFEVLHFGTSTLRGRFGPISGEVMLDDAAGRGEVGLRVATAGVSTGLRVLDARLREPDLLDSAGHPEAYFVARQFRFAGGRLTALRGEFTLRGTSQPLTLVARQFACREDAEQGRQVCGGDFEATFDRSDFGITLLLPFVANQVRLLVQVEGVRR